jgi:hypothetical protein
VGSIDTWLPPAALSGAALRASFLAIGTSQHTSLEVLVREPREPDSGPVVLLPSAPGSGTDALVRPLVESLDGGHWRLLPAPGRGADVLAQRAWHRDAWLAMPAADRDSVVFVTGPTAGYLAPVLAGAARTVVLVRGPLAGARAAGAELPKRRALERLAETPAEDVPARLRSIANPQSRTLLAPWHDPAELIVSPGPPSDAERWREALFGDVMPHVDASAIEQAPDVARGLAGVLGARPKPVVQAAKALVGTEADVPEDPAYSELLLRFNWLDAELYDVSAAALANARAGRER